MGLYLTHVTIFVVKILCIHGFMHFMDKKISVSVNLILITCEHWLGDYSVLMTAA